MDHMLLSMGLSPDFTIFILGCKDKCKLSYPNEEQRSTYASIEVDVCIKTCEPNHRLSV